MLATDKEGYLRSVACAGIRLVKLEQAYNRLIQEVFPPDGTPHHFKERSIDIHAAWAKVIAARKELVESVKPPYLVAIEQLTGGHKEQTHA